MACSRRRVDGQAPHSCGLSISEVGIRHLDVTDSALTAGTAAGSALALPAGWVAQTGGVESTVAWTDGAKADVAWTNGSAGVDCRKFVVKPGKAEAIFTTAKDAPRWVAKDAPRWVAEDEPSQFVRVEIEIDVDGDDLAFVC